MKKVTLVLLAVLILIPGFTFASNTNLSTDRYVDFLVHLMNENVYVDYEEFKNNPEAYYFKALELGLANLYIPYDATINDDIANSTIKRATELGLRASTLANTTTDIKEVNQAITAEDFSHVKMGYNFGSDFFGSFEGKLTGMDDFTGFKVQLLTRNGKLLEEFTLGKDGKFDTSGFDISLVTRLLGYKYEVYSPKGELVKKNNLS